jgi:hypothetical protein
MENDAIRKILSQIAELLEAASDDPYAVMVRDAQSSPNKLAEGFSSRMSCGGARSSRINPL